MGHGELTIHSRSFRSNPSSSANWIPTKCHEFHRREAKENIWILFVRKRMQREKIKRCMEFHWQQHLSTRYLNPCHVNVEICVLKSSPHDYLNNAEFEAQHSWQSPLHRALIIWNLTLFCVVYRTLRDDISCVAQIVHNAIGGVVRLLKVEICRTHLVHQDLHRQNSLASLLARLDYPDETTHITFIYS